MNRKIILTLIFIIILAIAGVLYFYFFQTPTGATQSAPGFFKSIFPFGSNAAPSTNNPDSPLLIGDTQTNNNIQKQLPRLRHYTTVPTAGDIITEKDKDVIQDRVKTTIKETSIRYIDRATGHIYDVPTNVEDPIKISNTTIPKIYEATFTPGGDSLITRFLDASDNIITYAITLKDKKPVVATTSVKISTTTATVVQTADTSTRFKDVTGTYLARNIREIAMSPNGKKILDLTYGTDNGILAILDSAYKSRTILASPLQEWLLSLPTETKAVITTKPSGITYGYSYIVNTDTGVMSKLIGNILGLTVLPSYDLSTLLVGEASATLKLSVLNNKDSSLNDLSVKTLPEKCVWANTTIDTVYCAVPKTIQSAVYPDDWYKGRLFFNDSLWKINLKTGETNLISNLSQESGQAIDAITLEVSPTDKYLTFINKRDLTLWGIDLTK
ncbi:MAG: hypothetical protein V4509_04420 [Patescibacteria group bacterium]